ncbi:MAG: glycosyltransferase family 39 protein, partial [Candidatus Daviesbacteria bacterium]|nr:glycosyltransferase family 39 protein [Candidatus Daviesbacteria bacterium]
MSPKLKDILILVLVNLSIAFLIWAPFYFRIPNLFGLNFSGGLEAIYRNFDGIEYIIIAKSWYQTSIISGLPQDLPASYFAAHFPGFSLLIVSFAPILGFLKSMLLVSLLFTILSSIMFYLLVKDFKLSSSPLFLSVVFLVLPARWLIVHSIGSAETVFIFFTISALYFFMKFEEVKKYQFIILAGFLGMFAQLTRPPGILLFLALSFYIIWKIIKDRNQNIFKRAGQAFISYLPLFLIPLALFSVFYYYSIAYQDFWAYFHSGD